MTDLTPDAIRKLLDGATPGKRCQFHPKYCPEAVGYPASVWDSSHEMSVIRQDGTPYKLAEYRHAADAALSQAAPDLARLALEQAAEIERLREALDIAGPIALADFAHHPFILNTDEERKVATIRAALKGATE